MLDIIDQTLRSHQQVVAGLTPLRPRIAALAQQLGDCLARGSRVFWCGNGGSAADAQHLAAELVGRFERDRHGFASIALTTNASILTAVGNDYGFEQLFARQVEALCRDGDLLVAISTSGTSANIIAALQAAPSGVFRAGLGGHDGGLMPAHTELCLCVPSSNAARIQEMHILIGHILCDLVERRLAPDGKQAESRSRSRSDHQTGD